MMMGWSLQEIASLQLALAKMEEKNKEHEVDIQQLKGDVKFALRLVKHS